MYRINRIVQNSDQILSSVSLRTDTMYNISVENNIIDCQKFRRTTIKTNAMMKKIITTFI
jgi:hypothetical protein